MEKESQIDGWQINWCFRRNGGGSKALRSCRGGLYEDLLSSSKRSSTNSSHDLELV